MELLTFIESIRYETDVEPTCREYLRENESMNMEEFLASAKDGVKRARNAREIENIFVVSEAICRLSEYEGKAFREFAIYVADYLNEHSENKYLIVVNTGVLEDDRFKRLSLVKDVNVDMYESLGLKNIVKQEYNPNISEDIRAGVEIEFESNIDEMHFRHRAIEGWLVGTDKTIHENNLNTGEITKFSSGVTEIEIDSPVFNINPINDAEKYDVEHGIEYRGAVANYSNYIKQIKDMVEVIRKGGGIANESCGMHVHVSNDKIREKDITFLENLTKDMVFMQEIILDKFLVSEMRKKYFTGPFDKDDTYETAKERPYKKQFINFKSINRKKTIEFRMFSLPYVIDENLIAAYIDIATSIIDSTAYAGSFKENIVDKINIKEEDLQNENVRNIMFDEYLAYIGVTDRTKMIISNLNAIFKEYKSIKLNKNKICD